MQKPNDLDEWWFMNMKSRRKVSYTVIDVQRLNVTSYKKCQEWYTIVLGYVQVVEPIQPEMIELNISI